MISVILAAGYATRLYPLTLNLPKPLLKVGEYTILDRLLIDLDEISAIDKHVIITNHNFYSHFIEWKKTATYKKEIIILNDGTQSNETRLGAVKDLLFAIETFDINDDLLVLAGDNVVDFSFSDFVNFANLKNTSCVCYHIENNLGALKKTGVLVKNVDGKVLAMYEKPTNPPSCFAVPPFYIYRANDISLIKEALNDGCDADAPGNLLSWLSEKTEVFAWEMQGKRYDVGDIASYNAVNDIFKTVVQ